MNTLGSVTANLLIVVLGILLLLNNETAGWFTYWIAVILGFVLFFRTIFVLAMKLRPFSKVMVCSAIFELAFSLIILIHPGQFLRFAYIFYGWWMIIHCVLSAINLYVSLRDGLGVALVSFVGLTVYIILAVLMILSNNLSLKEEVLRIIAGVSAIVYGTTCLLFLYVNRSDRKELNNSWTYDLPIILGAFMTFSVFLSIKNLERKDCFENEPDSDSDLHVYIYLKGKGPEIFGHVNISYKGTIYSYGCHDPKNRTFFGMLGDGIFIECDEKEFLQESLHTEHKTIVGYGVRLSESQKINLEKKIHEFKNRCVPMHCLAEEAIFENKDPDKETDYLSRLYKEAHPNYYRFKEGKFHTYFISITNCVNLADELLKDTDLNLIHGNLLSPGSYLHFLNMEYLKRNTAVISRTIYEAGTNEFVS